MEKNVKKIVVKKRMAWENKCRELELQADCRKDSEAFIDIYQKY